MQSFVLACELKAAGEHRTALGESPCWDEATGEIWWVDISGMKLLRMDAMGAIQSWDTPETPGFVVLMGAGRPAVGMQTGIFSFDPAIAVFACIVYLDGTGLRFNDATVGQDGRLWTSTMAFDGQIGAATIQYVTDQMTLATIVEGLTIPNGLAVDLERERLFYSDSHVESQSIWALPIRAGVPVPDETKLFATTKELGGRPDGAALDERGYYWIAGVDGSALYVFDPDGQLHSTLEVPFPAPTKITFLAEEGRRMAITSKKLGEKGGYLALADLPEAFASGLKQPYWNVGTNESIAVERG